MLQFNAGSALAASPLAAQVFLTTNTAAASAMLTWLLMDHLRGLKFRATGVCAGAVVGLVGVTPAAGEELGMMGETGGVGALVDVPRWVSENAWQLIAEAHHGVQLLDHDVVSCYVHSCTLQTCLLGHRA
jgi:ammonia channel protein AmtB